MNEQEKKLYEQGNPFLDYNHIKVVSASPDRAEMAVELPTRARRNCSASMTDGQRTIPTNSRSLCFRG